MRQCKECELDARSPLAKYCVEHGTPAARVRRYLATARGKETARAWSDANRDKVRARHNLYATSEAGKATRRQYRVRTNGVADKAYWKTNPGKRAAYRAGRRAAEKQATPSWVDYTALLSIYEQAARAGKHVDHIIPLQHPDVCGLHVPWNLQLLTPTENMSKGNKFPLDAQ